MSDISDRTPDAGAFGLAAKQGKLCGKPMEKQLTKKYKNLGADQPVVVYHYFRPKIQAMM